MSLADPINCRGCEASVLRPRRGVVYCDACRASCSADGCERTPDKGGYCGMHYRRIARNGALGGPPTVYSPTGVACSVPGCDDPSNLELWVKTQPCGQRATDRVRAAIALLKSYSDLAADEGYRLIALESQEATDLLVSEIETNVPGPTRFVI